METKKWKNSYIEIFDSIFRETCYEQVSNIPRNSTLSFASSRRDFPTFPNKIPRLHRREKFQLKYFSSSQIENESFAMLSVEDVWMNRDVLSVVLPLHISPRENIFSWSFHHRAQVFDLFIHVHDEMWALNTTNPPFISCNNKQLKYDFRSLF